MFARQHNLQTLQELRVSMAALGQVDTVRVPVMLAAIDYYIFVFENRGFFSLAFTNFDEREKDIQYISRQMKSNESVFLDTITTYIQIKSDTSEFKKRITAALQTGRAALIAKRAAEHEAKEYFKTQMNILVGVVGIAVVLGACSGNINLSNATIAVSGLLLVFYLFNKAASTREVPAVENSVEQAGNQPQLRHA